VRAIVEDGVRLGVHASFLGCKIYPTEEYDDSDDPVEIIDKTNDDNSDAEQTNCLADDYQDAQGFLITAATDNEGAILRIPAFRMVGAGEFVHLKCELLVCRINEADSACRKTCGESPEDEATEADAAENDVDEGRRRRRRRSANSVALTATKSVALNVKVPNKQSCSKPTLAQRATNTTHCTNGYNLGSVCKQPCKRGFEGMGGRRASTRVCQERITARIGPIYYQTAPAWHPENADCEDIDECLTNPCSINQICENTIGSYRCL